MKYDFDLDLETRNSLSLIVNRIRPNSTILEFGPANGRMTKYLKEKLNCKVYAVELDNEAAQEAKAFCEKIIIGDVEKYTWLEEYKNLQFDYIVFADILEHLYDPEKTLQRVKPLLKGTGSILMSIPNIAHNSIIMDLLQDKFTYRKVGLLDNTHIRFFTKNTLDELIEKIGFEIKYETGAYANPEQTEFTYRYDDFNNDIRSILKNREFGEIYQFVIEAKNKAEDTFIDFSIEEQAILYIDTGKGFHDDEKIISTFIYEKSKMITFDLDKPIENVKAIRIDPLDNALELKYDYISINSYKSKDKILNNGKIDKTGKIIFLHNDPQFIINFESPVKIEKVALHFEYLTKIFNVTDQIIQEKDQEIQESNHQIQLRKQRIQELDALAQSLRIKNRIKKNIKRIIPSKLWNIMRFVKHNRSAIGKGFDIFRSEGPKVLIRKIKEVNNLSESKILNTYMYKEEINNDVIKSELKKFKEQPLISIIMPVYNVDPKWLELAISSIEKQWYLNWELCIADDKSTNKKTLKYLKSLTNKKIKITFLNKNGNIVIASNEALKLVRGEYVALMDNDDELTPNALYEVVKAINLHKVDFVYSDEDKLEMDGTFSEPHFKPDFAPDMLLSQNYMSHLAVIKKELIDKVDGFTVGLEGSQDYDLYLKVLEHTNKVHHIAKVLYHWRKIPGSTAANFSDKSYAQHAGLKALENAMKRRNIKANILNGKYPGTYKIDYDIKNNPLVSIIIPFKDKPELLTMCIESILSKTSYPNFEIIGISNNSEEESTFIEMTRLEKMDKRIKFYEYNVDFNYSDINNYAVRTYVKGEQVLLLNNDIKIITPRWIEEMLMHSQREEVGVVGAKLYYPNDTIQHAGVIIGLGGIAGHSHKYFDKNHPGYFYRLNLIQNLSGVTAACLMVKKSIYEEVDGLNEENLKIAFNDVDFCLRVQEKGYKNIFTPYCEAYHYESISRGAEDTIDKQNRFKLEIEYIRQRHSAILENGDPYYNENLTLDREDFTLR